MKNATATKNVTATKKLDRDYVPTPRDKNILDASQDTLLQILEEPSSAKKVLPMILILIAVMARYPKRTLLPDMEVTMLVSTTFAQKEAQQSWTFTYRDGGLSVSLSIIFNKKQDDVKELNLFNWEAVPGDIANFEDHRKGIFKAYGIDYEKDIKMFMLSMNLPKTKTKTKAKIRVIPNNEGKANSLKS